MKNRLRKTHLSYQSQQVQSPNQTAKILKTPKTKQQYYCDCELNPTKKAIYIYIYIYIYTCRKIKIAVEIINVEAPEGGREEVDHSTTNAVANPRLYEVR